MKLKQHFRKAIYVLSVGFFSLIFYSCGDESLLDVKKVEYTVDSEWRFPAVYGKFTIDSLLKVHTLFNEQDLITFDNGNLAIRQEVNDFYSLNMKDKIPLNSVSYKIQKDLLLPKLTIPENLLDKFSELFVPMQEEGEEALEVQGLEYFKKLKADLSFDLKINSVPVPLKMTVSLPTVFVGKNAYKYVVDIPANTEINKTIPTISNAIVTSNPTTHKLPYKVVFEAGEATEAINIPDDTHLKVELKVKDCSVKYVEAVLSPVDINYVTERKKIDIRNLKTFTDKVKLKDVDVKLKVKSEGMKLPFEFTPKIKSFGENKTLELSPVKAHSLNFDCLDKVQTTTVSIGKNTNISDVILLDKGYEIGCNVKVNKEKEMCHLKENASLSIGAEIVIPLNLQLKKYEIKDTIPFDLSISDKKDDFSIKVKKNAHLTILAENKLPLSFAITSLVMLDKDKKPLKNGKVVVDGNLTGADIDENGFALKSKKSSIKASLTQEQIDMIDECKHFVFYGNISDATNGKKYVKLTKKDSLKVSVVLGLN